MTLDVGTGTSGAPSANGRYDDDASRPSRLPRWTRQEILVLIQGKRVAEGGVTPRRAAPGHAQPESKWASVASYCRRHGVSRGPVQCRKRWSNLAGDFRKIREWELQKKGESESFWVMRSDARRERRLPGFFDRDVYDILDGGEVRKSGEEVTAAEVGDAEEEEVIFDSGRAAAAEEGLFSDGEQWAQEEGRGSSEKEAASPDRVDDPTPISEKRCIGNSNEGMTNGKQMVDDTENETSQGHKWRRVAMDGRCSSNLQSQLMEVLQQNSRMLIAQMEAQNTNSRLDRDLRKDHADGLVDVLGKLADAVYRIADKL